MAALLGRHLPQAPGTHVAPTSATQVLKKYNRSVIAGPLNSKQFIMVNLNYPVNLKAAEDGGFVVTFPQVPEAITQGEDEGDALLRAVDALETALSFYIDAGEDLPIAAKVKRGQRIVRPSALACIKLAIYQSMREQGVKKSDLARRLGWHMPQVDRLLDLNHASRLDQAEAALASLGLTIEIRVA